MKRGVKKIYRKLESRWENDEPDIHGNHRRRLKPGQERKLRRFLQREANKFVKENERI